MAHEDGPDTIPIRIRRDPPWPERCRPSPPRDRRQNVSLSPIPGAAKSDPSGPRGGDVDVISLHEASRRMGLLLLARKSWNPLLLSLCAELGIDVRRVPGDAPCIRDSDLPRLERRVRKHLDRKPLWGASRPRKNPSGRP